MITVTDDLKRFKGLLYQAGVSDRSNIKYTPEFLIRMHEILSVKMITHFARIYYRKESEILSINAPDSKYHVADIDKVYFDNPNNVTQLFVEGVFLAGERAFFLQSQFSTKSLEKLCLNTIGSGTFNKADNSIKPETYRFGYIEFVFA